MMKLLKALCLAGVVSLFAAASAQAVPPLLAAQPDRPTIKILVECYSDCWHSRWRSHFRWGSHESWGGCCGDFYRRCCYGDYHRPYRYRWHDYYHGGPYRNYYDYDGRND